ncbi:serine hydrolase domain-containing protein [Arthrospiribacter ruber]|uniref:Class A beta-lactamase-related serine hydrolase n=1 Tax=Arthrospiribacter ruber TaxID=2487934 RepID=A0A951J119_9BACT|nr:serine hydrolase domain-containing protein [Arthrospiribacter ruber]MBW3469337.1 class A beta-lactamase-related serine hydrolase [Arthrospiribacter ruber]
MIKKLGVLFLAFSLFSTSFSQEFDKQKLEQYLEAYESAEKVMGSLTISVEGKPVFQKAIGYMDLEEGIPASPQTKYRIGSISKTFTAVLIMKAIEEGKLNLKTTLNTFFTEIPNADEITVRHLLQHRSGIYNFTNSPDYLTYNTQTKSKPEMLQLIIDGGTVFAPDSKAEYSNSNYVLLTWILEAVYEKPFSEIMNEKITQPLGLRNTYLGGAIRDAEGEAYSYEMQDGWVKSTETDMSIPLGAGALVSNGEDLGKFAHGLFEGKLISAESLEQMKTFQDGIGLGLFVIPFGDKKSYGHGGGIDGFRSLMSYFQDEKMTFVFLSNGAEINPNDIALGGLSAFFGQDYEIPVFSNEQLDEDELERLTGTYGADGFPLDIKISKKGKRLFGQATGQPEFPLTYEGDHVFSFNQAGLKIEFDPENDKIRMKQSGMTFELEKKAKE